MLNTINIIRNESMLMELKYSDLEERYRTRCLYAQPEEVAQCASELADASQVCASKGEKMQKRDILCLERVRSLKLTSAHS